MHNEKKPFRYIKTKVYLNDHLKGVRQRLFDDVGPYIELVQKKVKYDKVGIGNFALIRMLFPPIETISRAIEKKPQDLLNELGIKSPYLYWSLFRDVFMHNDEFENAIYKLNEIRPGIGIAYPGGSGGHTFTQSVVMITVTKLYFDLIYYIDNYVKNSDENKMISINTGIEYLEVDGDSAQHQEVDNIIKEILKLKN